MLHRIRLAMQRKSLMKLGGSGGEVEAVETFIGGAARFMNPARRKRIITGRGVTGKNPAIGFLDRAKLEVRAAVISGRRRHHVEPRVIANVKPGTMVYSDNLPSYTNCTIGALTMTWWTTPFDTLIGAFTPMALRKLLEKTVN